jgi:oxygen-dependent protoporphyrinogen oxidase
VTGTAPLVVVGGGISGLATAWHLSRSLPGRRVVVLEQRGRTGGVLRREVLPAGPGVPTGVRVDTGAESLLARRPEALDLIRDLGLDADLVHPRTSRAGVVSRGAVHPMPAGTLMGVPSDVAGLAGLLTDDELRRAAAEPERPAPVDGDDVAVGPWVADRLGRAVVDRLVEPLLGGVYAGHADRLSLRSCVPALWPAARDGTSLVAAAAAAVAAQGSRGTAAGDASPGLGPGTSPSAPVVAGPPSAPVFAGLRGGVSRLAEELTRRLQVDGVRVRTGVCVQALRRTAAGWELRLGPDLTDGHARVEVLAAAAVVLAVPAPAAARLLTAVAPEAARLLSGVTTASTAIVTVAVDADALADIDLSGLLVPPVEGRAVKALTLSSSKWTWMAQQAPGLAVLRMSVGRAGEERSLHRDDDALVRLAVDDAAALLDRRLVVRSGLVTRWGGALPQYEVGHADLVGAALADVASVGALACAGSAYRGVGVPACLESAALAAAAVTASVA